MPPDLVPQLGQYFAILSELEGKVDGGKAPTSAAAAEALQAEVCHEQCLASKSLDIRSTRSTACSITASYAVVAAPPTLAANPVAGPVVQSRRCSSPPADAAGRQVSF